MENLAPHDITVMFLSLGVLLAAARVLGELAQHLHQPAVLGELLAGILLGPSVLGSLAPTVGAFLFPLQGPGALALDPVSNLAIVLFLMVAGIEVDLSSIFRQGRLGGKIGITSIAVPFFFGLVMAWLIPGTLGRDPEADPLIFTVFFATALSISALPVIAKTLMDMDLYRSDLGMVAISAAVFNDLIGWIIFAIILGWISDTGAGTHTLVFTIFSILVFVTLLLTIGRWVIHKALPFVQAYTRWPGGELSFALILALFGAALTEWIGVHAIFGAFLVGVAVGDSPHLRERTRVIIEQFVSFIFAPVFFASIGLKINFLLHFDPVLVLVVLLIACLCKLAGGSLGARWGGMPLRDALAVGFALNSRGAMEIILALLALQFGIIKQPLFVALVIMAIVTSMMSGPAIKLILRPAKKWRLQNTLKAKLFFRNLHASNRREAVHEMTTAMCTIAGLDPHAVENAVWGREEALSTGIGQGVALPHARIEGLREPVVAVGISRSGIDFDAPDGKPANVIFLLLTPADNPGIQLVISSEISRLFRRGTIMDRVMRARNFTDFLALIATVSDSEPRAAR